MKKSLSICRVVDVLLLLNLVSIDAEVITLTADTFSDKSTRAWEDVCKAMEGDDQIEIGQVDCGAERSVCTKVDIHSYPTFKLFFDGEEVARFQGPRNVDTLKAFVLEEAVKAAAKARDNDTDL